MLGVRPVDEPTAPTLAVDRWYVRGMASRQNQEGEAECIERGAGSGPSTVQIGAIAENLVANALIVGSSGRLSPFRPVADDGGIDVLVYDKDTGRALPVQVKARTVTLIKRGGGRRGDLTHFEIRKKAVPPGPHAYLVAVLLDPSASRIEHAWVINIRHLIEHARTGPEKLVMRASRSATSKDKWTDFRCDSVGGIAERLMTVLDALDGRPIR